MKPPKPRKPRPLNFVTHRPVYITTHWGTPCTYIDGGSYTAKESRRLALWLILAAEYLEQKEKK